MITGPLALAVKPVRWLTAVARSVASAFSPPVTVASATRVTPPSVSSMRQASPAVTAPLSVICIVWTSVVAMSTSREGALTEPAAATCTLVVKLPPSRLTRTRTAPSLVAVKEAAAASALTCATSAAAICASVAAPVPTVLVYAALSSVSVQVSPATGWPASVTSVALGVVASMLAELPNVKACPARFTSTSEAPSAVAVKSPSIVLALTSVASDCATCSGVSAAAAVCDTGVIAPSTVMSSVQVSPATSPEPICTSAATGVAVSTAAPEAGTIAKAGVKAAPARFTTTSLAPSASAV